MELYHVGIDIGGTFTDCTVIDREGEIFTTKSPSTPTDFSEGFFNCLKLAAEKLKLPTNEFIQKIDLLCHGTTVGTNAMVQRRGNKVGLITTKGFGDSILMMRSFGRVAGLSPYQTMKVKDTYKPEPIVPRTLIKQVSERVDWKGSIVSVLNEDDVRLAIAELINEGVEAISVSLLWSFKNPSHEKRIKTLIAEMAPEVFVTCSSDLVPKIGEYERTAATVINSYIGPVSAKYLNGIEARIQEAGFRGSFLIMQSGGGLFSCQKASEQPLLTLNSGPVGGIVASNFLAQHLDIKNIIATDMGGTTFDVGIISNGEPITTTSSIIGQYEYFVPTVEIKSIGAGGGSIAWIDPVSNVLKVGPQSAGADPGPVCYNKGGAEITVTDADLLLGYLNEDYFLGGNMKLAKEKVNESIKNLAEKLGLTIYETANGINKIVDFQMADLIRKLTIEKGIDPRDYVLLAYGGAGPIHAGVFAKELGCKAVIVPLGDISSVWSSLGVVSSDILQVSEEENIMQYPFDSQKIKTIFKSLVNQSIQEFKNQGIESEDYLIQSFMDIRYKSQVNEVEIPVNQESMDEASIEQIKLDFEERYSELYGKGTGYSEAGIEAVTFRTRVSIKIAKPSFGNRELTPNDSHRDEMETKNRDIYWDEIGRFVKTPVLRVETFEQGNIITGPAIVEASDTTIVIRPQQKAMMDGLGNFIIDLKSEGDEFFKDWEERVNHYHCQLNNGGFDYARR